MSSIPSHRIRVAGIVNDSITDGPGLRFTLFMQGCPKNCPGCHNQSTIPLEGGTLYSTQDIMEKIKKNPMLSGVTFSGGEPMLQAEALIGLAKKIKAEGLNLAIYTGYTFEELLEKSDSSQLELLWIADTIIDGPFMLDRISLSLKFRGSANQRILDLKKSLSQGQAVIETSPSWVEY